MRDVIITRACDPFFVVVTFRKDFPLKLGGFKIQVQQG